MKKSDAAPLMEKSSCEMTFTYSDTEVSAVLYRMVSQNPGDMAGAVFRCEDMPSGFDYTRMQPVQIHTAEYRGFEIPQSALRILDGWEGVYILDEVAVDYRRVLIAYEGDGYYLVTGVDGSALSVETGDDTATDTADECPYGWIQMNDVVIAEGRGLDVGKVVQGAS